MQSQGKNIRKLTRSLEDYKAAPNTRLDTCPSEINTLYNPQSLNGPADWSSVDGPLDFDILLQVSDEPESELMGAPWGAPLLLPSMLDPLQAQEQHSVFGSMAFAQDMSDCWVATSSQNYLPSMSMEDIQPSLPLVHHSIYPSPTLSPSWDPYSSFNTTHSPAPVPQFFSNHLSAVPAHCSTPCADQVYNFFAPASASVTTDIPQNHSSAETAVPRSPISPCPPTRPRSSSSVKKTPNRSKKANGSIHRCQYCPKTFSRPYNLSSHLKTHSGVKPYACNYEGCKSAFLRPYDLARHERNHNGQKPFICNGCSEPFKRHEGLKRHERSCCL